MNIPKQLLHYEIRERIGAGGMGEVYRAWDSKLDREVALKVLPPQVAADIAFKKRFEREARAVAALNHPNIVTIHSVEQAEGIHFLTMELVKGQSLDSLIPPEGMPVTELLKHAVPMIDAVASAHHQGIIHRDLKPQNVMVDTEGRLKVLDFGLAKMTKAASPTPEAATQTLVTAYGENRVMGTLRYMSPEQAQGQELDPRSDVFSLGIMLYQMATGQRPFGGDSPMSVLSSIIKDDPAPVHEIRPQVPPGLSRIIHRALAKDPQERYANARELRDDLQGLEKDPASATRPGGGRRRYLVPVSAVGALVALFLIVNPLKLEIGFDEPEAAAKERLAVLTFENLADPEDSERLGAIVSNLLITALSQSEYLSMVSSERLQELTKRRGGDDLSVLDPQSATEVAAQAGANTILRGSILKASPYVATFQLVDIGTKEILGSQRVDSESGEDIFAFVDRIGLAVKRDLALPDAGEGDEELPVASVTTSSLDAYRLYVQAGEKVTSFNVRGAKKDLERAVGIDSTFAMAYFKLAQPVFVGYGVSTIEERRQAARQAARLAERVTPREQRYIRAQSAVLDGRIDEAIAELEALVAEDPNEYAAYSYLSFVYRDHKQDRERQIHYLNRLLELDPADPDNYNSLAYAYWGIGNLEQAVWAINQAIRLAPDDPNTYQTRGEFYAWRGDLEKAIESFETANRINPRWGLGSLAYIRQEKGDAGEIREMYQQTIENTNNPAHRAVNSRFLAGIAARGGRLSEAIETLSQAMNTAELEGYIGLWYWQLLMSRARMHHFRNEFDQAETDARRALEWAVKAESIDSILFWAHLIVMLSQREEFDAAEEELAALREHTERLYPKDLFLYWWARGWLEMERGDLTDACSSLEESIRLERSSFRTGYALGVAYRGAGRGKDAVRELEMAARGASLTERKDPVWSGLSYYQLGRAYEDAGRRDDAAAEYETFLDLFRDADPVFDEVADAEARLERLRATR